MTAATDGPLSGIRIIDLSRLAPGPFATMLLGDLGADVILVEPPPSRTSSPLDDMPDYGPERARAAGRSPLFRSCRSVVADLKSDDGRETVLRLAATADVFLEGFRPGTCDRLGVGYHDVAARRPDIIYASITGYGQAGDLSQVPGHDLNYLAEAGLLAATTRGDGPPGIPANAVADFAAGGLTAAFGILAALRGRDVHGVGTYIDVSMYQGLLALLQTVPGWTAVGAADPSWGRGLLTGACPYYDCYRTEDGRWISVGALEPPFFRNLLAALDLEHLAPAYDRPEQWPTLRRAFQDAFAAAPLDTWLQRFETVDTAIAPVRSIDEAFAFARRRGLADDHDQVGAIPPMSAWDTTPGPPASVPGQHTEEVLTELGWTPDEIDGLLRSAAVEQAPAPPSASAAPSA